MYPDKSTPRILQQQQPSREGGDRGQQQSGSTDFQPKPQAGAEPQSEPKPASQPGGEAKAGGDRPQQMGEGSYEATRDYQKNIGEYMDKADVASDAEAAKPRSEEEARQLKAAEREGRSHSKGEH